MVKDHAYWERGYSFRLAARVLLYASSHRQDNTYHSLCYTCRGALAGTSTATKLTARAVAVCLFGCGVSWGGSSFSDGGGAGVQDKKDTITL